MSKGSKRRPENFKAVNDRWPFGDTKLNVMSEKDRVAKIKTSAKD